MWDLALMTIFINHPLYVGFIFPIWDQGVTNSPSEIPNVLVKATSCKALVPHDLALLGGSDTICND